MSATQAMPLRLMRSDRDRTMITPEGIVLPITVASRGARAGALIMDLALVTVIMVATTLTLLAMAGGMATVMTQAEAGGAIGNALQFLLVLWIIAMFLLRSAWFLYFELGPRGATPGKRITGMRVAARNGGRLTAEMVIARNLLRDIELFLPLTFLSMASEGGDMGLAGMAALAWFLIFALFPLFNRDRMRAGDLIAGTWVVEAPKRKLEAAMSAARPSATPQAQDRFAFTAAELAVYGEYELQTLERVLRENRMESLEQVHAAICGKIGRPPKYGEERAFLEAYYTQLRARLEAGMRMGRRKADKHADGA